jgi:hypothetical protein
MGKSDFTVGKFWKCPGVLHLVIALLAEVCSFGQMMGMRSKWYMAVAVKMSTSRSTRGIEFECCQIMRCFLEWPY